MLRSGQVQVSPVPFGVQHDELAKGTPQQGPFHRRYVEMQALRQTMRLHASSVETPKKARGRQVPVQVLPKDTEM